jgi:3-methyladenine DNA glycosylase AlkD
MKSDAIIWAIRELVPTAQYYLFGTDLSTLRWMCDEVRPTDEEIINKAQEWEASQIVVNAEAAAKREVALAKLAALGLEPDDLKALGLA